MVFGRDPGLADELERELGGQGAGREEQAPQIGEDVAAPVEAVATFDESSDFDISLQSEVKPLPDLEPIEVEDRFGLEGDDERIDASGPVQTPNTADADPDAAPIDDADVT